jgi:hypothetical protein
MIGGVPQEYRAHDVYNINKRISMFISTCQADLENEKMTNTPSNTMEQNTKVSDDILNWLSPLMNQTISGTTAPLRKISSEAETDTVMFAFTCFQYIY